MGLLAKLFIPEFKHISISLLEVNAVQATIGMKGSFFSSII